MKKGGWLLFLLVVSLLMSGCWSRREVEDLALVTGFGIDRVESGGQNAFEMSFLIIRPAEIGGQKSPAAGKRNSEWLVSQTGETLYEAQQQIAVRSPRVIRVFHSREAVLGEKLARAGIQEAVDYMNRNEDIRQRNLVFVSRGDAYDILSTLPEMENALSAEIGEIIAKSNPEVSESYPVDLKLLTESLIVPGWDPVCPAIRVTKPKALSTSRGAKEPPETIVLDGLGVFKKDKLVGFLSNDEAKGFLYLAGKAGGGVVPAKVKKFGGEVSFVMTHASSKIKPVIKDARLMIEIEITAGANIGEVKGDIKVGDPKVLKELNKVFADEVRHLTEATLKKAQKQYKADILGLGSKVHLAYPGYWKGIEKDWDKIYPEVPVSVKVKGTITGTMEVSDPFMAR